MWLCSQNPSFGALLAYCRPPSWMELIPKLRVGFRKISSSASASTEPVSGPDYCQIGMTSTCLGNHVNARESRSNVLTAESRDSLCALNARSSLIRALFCPLTKTIGDVRTDDLVIPSALPQSTVRFESLSMDVAASRCSFRFLRLCCRCKSDALAGPPGEGGHHQPSRGFAMQPPLCLR